MMRLGAAFLALFLGSCVTDAGGSALYTGSDDSMVAMISAARSCNVKRMRVENPPRTCADCDSNSRWLHLLPAWGSREAKARRCLANWMRANPTNEISLVVQTYD